MNYSPKDIAKLTEGKLISSCDLKINHVSTDSRSVQNSRSTIFFALKTENRDGHNFTSDVLKAGVKTLVVSKNEHSYDSSISVIKVKDTLQALQNFAAAHRANFITPVIGITGSYGKTMVKEWLYQLLSPDFIICRSPKSFNSQLGVPLSVLLLNESHTLAIFEAGISEVGEMENLERMIKPTMGVLVKMGEVHQQGFISLEEKIKEKKKLLKNCVSTIELPIKLEGFTFPFSDKASIENCEICVAVMQQMDYANNVIQERINLLTPLALRLEMKKGIENSTVINDGYNISYSSLVLSLEYLNLQAKTFPKTVIISDIPETPFSDKKLINLLNSSKLKQILVIGNNKLEGIETGVLVHYFTSTQELKQEINQYDFQDHFILIKGSRIHRLEQIAQVLEKKNHRTVLEIDLNKLSTNVSIYKNKLRPNVKVMAMVKAFSYGAGTVEIPKILEQEGVDYLGVAYTEEGIALRNNGIKTPIVVLNPEPGSFSDLISYELQPEIYSLQELDEFVRDLIVAGRQDFPIHIKLETGMNRLGFLPNEIPKLIQYIKSQPEVYIKTVFSHLSSADDKEEEDFTLRQIKKFELYSNQLTSAFNYPIDKHILNTAGIENYPEYQFDMVRLGIGMYGINVSDNSEIKPISSLKTVIIQLKKLNKGDSIGYGRQTIAEEGMIIAILPIGYSDGLRRSLGNGNYSFYVNGEQCSLAGNICMDICMINVTNCEVKVGDEIEIFGEHNSIEDLANTMGTIPYEVLTSISQRVKRVFYKD
ncbi:MAG: alanine racemase [Flavobacteriales bacterium]